MLVQHNRNFNKYFLVPFLLWCIVGGYFLANYDSKSLFVYINNNNNSLLDKLMEIASSFGEAWMIIVFGLVFLALKPFRNVWFLLAVILCTILPAVITQIIKFQVSAPRPMSVFANEVWVHHLDHWALLHNNSFPSGHTTGAFSFFCLLASVLPKGKRMWGLLFFFMALATGYARVYLAAHFFADIYFGSIIGTVCSLIIYHLVFFAKGKYAKRQIL